MEVWEKPVELRVRRDVSIFMYQLKFMPGHSTNDVIHLVIILVEKYKKMKKGLANGV